MDNTFTVLENFGHSLKAASYVMQPTCADDIAEVFERAKKLGLTVTPRGGGRSYNGVALNGGGIILDTMRMNRITKWNPRSGIVTCEPGVSLQQLWQKVLPDGWWPPVVSGTMFTTLGGCLASNIHGKNNFHAGPIGEHVLEFSALLPSGARVTCSPHKNSDLFYSIIGGLGMLGVFTSITIQMKAVHSGLLEVHGWATPSLKSHLDDMQSHAPASDYIVGWLDLIHGDRGQLHSAKLLPTGVDAHAAQTVQLESQTLPRTFFGVLPKSLLHYFMSPFWNNAGMRMINTLRYTSGLWPTTYRQSHAEFHFLLDFVPQWERAYGRGGLIQYQSFLPKEAALHAWTEMLARAKRQHLPAYLGVTKRHRPDKFLLTHAVDGFSLAMDFKITDRNRVPLGKMLQEFDEIVLAHGGRFYFAKNSETTAETARKFYGLETLAKFKKLKQRCDPRGLLESDLYRRVFGA